MNNNGSIGEILIDFNKPFYFLYDVDDTLTYPKTVSEIFK